MVNIYSLRDGNAFFPLTSGLKGNIDIVGHSWSSQDAQVYSKVYPRKREERIGSVISEEAFRLVEIKKGLPD